MNIVHTSAVRQWCFVNNQQWLQTLLDHLESALPVTAFCPIPRLVWYACVCWRWLCVRGWGWHWLRKPTKDLGLDPLDSAGSQGTCPGWAPWRTGVRSGHAGCHHKAWRKPQDSTNQAHMLKKAGPDLFCVKNWSTSVFFFFGWNQEGPRGCSF